MKKLIIEDGLLLTDMELTFNGQLLHFKRVLVDTGSGSTVVSTDLAESIGIVAEENDMIYRISGVGGSEFVYSKTVDSVKIGNMQTEGFALEIGPMNYGFDLDGIIGLDLLQKLKAVINIDELLLQSNC
ncbi:retroviral-like aspartic protease family protein [Aquibacillus sp. 3ASR75-11]|uniref:Retroviral-like aspartic protease family protein n=1 Tax=Terrihalobacillus insolitus TaxID=2950438 RepID=A0A9X3WYG0_9BACI|nr:retropepsin-like aspartic protease [Terrihalobacillus insolitus]MDC3413247.1 retroviral-like aspartic protease family protein [Terrihalobacillus insolitus]MDC3425699.1 retroviral-like aspartic protease family protein [Terrihalobacillus insolitus]